ncbi:MAG: 4Fe-4S dicluster domain-containing protein [Actinobacteria bacterium]|nr:MAG: 4Fe-4S dicluster domain-containing protein [Actinomycetota bacterium]
MFGTGMAKGFSATIRRAFMPAWTVLYPYEVRQLPERSRMRLAMSLAEDGSTDCKACLACANACPDHALRLDVDTGDGRRLVRMVANVGRCTFCGLCVEACPTGCLGFTGAFDMAVRTREATIATLFESPAGQAHAAERQAERQ